MISAQINYKILTMIILIIFMPSCVLNTSMTNTQLSYYIILCYTLSTLYGYTSYYVFGVYKIIKQNKYNININ